MLTEARKDEIREHVECSVRASGIRMVTFGRRYVEEEKRFALHYGQNFGLRREGDGIMVPAGMTK